jgi:hypothetical protein
MRRLALLGVAFGFIGCGGSTPSSPQAVATPTPTPLPTPTPTPVAENLLPDTYCVPKPPPTAALRVKVHTDFGFKKLLDSRALVGPDADYCSSIGQPGTVCVVRNEDDPQAVSCNNYAMGKALDTGRYGPTWYQDGQVLCRPPGDGGNDAGCRNHEDNQFLLYAFGPGIYTACAANGICKAIEIQ